MRLFHLFFYLVGIVFLVAGCAKQGSPPGGPEDIIPPKLLDSEPVSGSVNVPQDSRIVIKFDEAIDRTTVERALFISPLPDPEPKINLKSDGLVVIPRQNLLPNKTYVVTIGTDLRDAHRVDLDQSISIAFSTGATIDSGSIQGKVYKSGRGTPGISLALFEELPEKADRPIDSIAPEYLTQSGEGGLFTFGYLPSDTFYLAAFEDKNKDRRINPGREMIGIPYRATILDARHYQLKDIDIQLHTSDTSTLGLRSVTINPDRLLKVRFSHNIEKSRADSLFANVVLTEEADTNTVVPIIGYTNLTAYPASDYVLATGLMDVEKSYRIVFDLSQLYPQLPDSLKALNYTLTIPDGRDQTPPVLLESIPADSAANINPDSLLQLRFSEIIDSASLDSAVMLIKAAEESSLVVMTERDDFTYVGSPMPGLEYGQSYQLLVDAPKIRDLSGNRMSDSMVSIVFSTIGLDTLGQISGEVKFDNSSDAAYPVVVSFQPAPQGVAGQLTIPPGQEQFITNLLPGYYTVSAYLDRNGNGRFDYGSIIPYRLAEPFTAPADTFRVRTRFESAGVIIEL